jgi:hypothetical protein
VLSLDLISNADGTSTEQKASLEEESRAESKATEVSPDDTEAKAGTRIIFNPDISLRAYLNRRAGAAEIPDLLPGKKIR